jgi:hypothetical protein
VRFEGIPFLPLLAMLLASGCGGAEAPAEGGLGVTVEIPTNHRLGGAATGIPDQDGLTLVDGNAGRVTLVVDGPFWFERTLPRGTPYSASIEVLAPGRYCSLTNPAGVMGSHDMAVIEVACRLLEPSGIPASP